MPGIADLPKARGALVSKFLKDEAMTHLFFIDADVQFEPTMIERFVFSGHDLVAGMYPKKHINWNGMTGYIETLMREDPEAETIKIDYLNPNNPNNPLETLLCSHSHDFPFEFLHEENPTRGGETGTLQIDPNGFAEIKRAPTGFLMVTRQALVDMVEAYPELAYEDPGSGDVHYGLFHPLFVDVNESSRESENKNIKGSSSKKMYLSEDFSFCDRWRNVNGNSGVWVDTVGFVGQVLSPSVTFSGEGWIGKFIEKGGDERGLERSHEGEL